MNLGLRAIGLLLVATSVAVAEMRSWTFEASGSTLEGEVAGFSGDTVTLKCADGKTFSVPIIYLIPSNRAYLVAERAKQWKEVEVVKVESAESAGRYKKCTVHGTGVSGEVFVDRLPSAVETILNNRSQQNAQITNLSHQVESESRVAQKKTGAAPRAAGNRANRRAVAAQRAQANVAAQDQKADSANLANLKKSYDDYVQKTKAQTTLKMRNTGALYKGLSLWQCFDPLKPQE